MEHADRVAVVPGDFGWSDIGSWTSFGALIPEDSSGNRVLGESVLEDAQHCIVHSADRLTALLGVEDSWWIHPTRSSSPARTAIRM